MMRLVACTTYMALLYGFIFLPVGVLVLFSFQDGRLPIPPFRRAVACAGMPRCWAIADLMAALLQFAGGRLRLLRRCARPGVSCRPCGWPVDGCRRARRSRAR